jgi:hypothetical protein
MNAGALFAAALLAIAALPARQGPPPVSPEPPLSQTFISAAQVVIDDAIAVDIKADNDHIAGPMQQLKSASDNLTGMASGDHEKEVAASMKDMIFQISSCHIQSIDGTPTDKCQAQIQTAELQAMTTLNRHKDNGAWVQGPPT